MNRDNPAAVPLIPGAPKMPGCYVLLTEGTDGRRDLSVWDVDHFDGDEAEDGPGLYVWDLEGFMQKVSELLIVAHLPICFKGEE